MQDKPVIFISYSHLDEPEHPRADEVAWLTFVQRYLKPAVKDGRFEVWVDRHMEGGTDWDPEIERRLRECDVFVLLVSTHSMASDYVIDREIAIVRERQGKGDNVHFYPIVLTPTPKAGLDKVNDKNLRPRDGKPLSGYASHDRMQHMKEIADEIAALVEEIAKEKAAAAPRKRAPTSGVRVEIAGLPETPYVNLVGRDDELEQLDAAWDDPQINIVSLVAEGGAGKTSLLNEWLVRLQMRGYAGAEAVLGWSFYSQGSKERATSAEEFLNWAVDQLSLTPSSNTSTAKATAIAEILETRRILLALDGVEPMQHGPDAELGKLKDAGLRELLRRVATASPRNGRGLIVLTTRTAVADIGSRRKTTASVIDLDRLSDEAGLALLKDNGVWGTTAQLRETVKELGGHALTLSLLAGFLAQTQNGDVRRRDHLRQVSQDDDPLYAHANRVIKSYAEEWLAKDPVLDAIMFLIGLFDRPADAGCLRALRALPTIAGLTEPIHEGEKKISLIDRLLGRRPSAGLSGENWNKAVARLQAARLLLPPDPRAPDALDAHPLVREWFGERLRMTNETAWCAAHGRLYEHLRETTKEGETPTLEDLAPLYQAIAHGCRAGRHQEVLDVIYKERICRRRPDGRFEFYASQKLGALGSDLAAISWFFKKPYVSPVTTLRPSDQFWVLGQAALRLSVQGRLAEALRAQRVTLRLCEEEGDRLNAAIAAANLAEAELSVGDVAAAVVTAEKSIAHADQSGDKVQMMMNRSGRADALHAAGRRAEAEALFADAERRQKEGEPGHPLLYSVQGYWYCDLLLAKGDDLAARDRANETVLIARHNNWLLDIALDTLILGWACLRLALANADLQWAAARDDTHVAHMRFNESIDGLRASGDTSFVPRGLLARAAFRRSIGDWSGAARDLDEVEEIAEPGPMKLHLCDMALERARMAFARIEAFAPVNGMLEKDNPAKPEVPSKEEIAELKAEAGKQIKIADDYIQSCGYHRRDEELAELQAVLRGEKTFASLPPRV